jgi:hypothetical protein
LSEATGGTGGIPGGGTGGGSVPGGNQLNGSSPGDGVAASTLLDRRQVLIVLPGLLLAILLAMLDQLIVGTALPRIVGSLGGVTHLSWVVTAYILASTVTTPFYGKLGDMYGRKKLFVTAIVIFLSAQRCLACRRRWHSSSCSAHCRALARAASWSALWRRWATSCRRASAAGT